MKNERRQTLAANYVIPVSRSDQDEIILYSDMKNVLVSNAEEHELDNNTIFKDHLQFFKYLFTNEKASTYISLLGGLLTLGSSLLIDITNWKTFIPQIVILIVMNYLFCVLCDLYLLRSLIRTFDFWFNIIIYTIDTVLRVVYREGFLEFPLVVQILICISSFLSVIMFMFCISICDVAPQTTQFMRRGVSFCILIYCIYSLVLSYFILEFSNKEICILLYACSPISSVIRSLKTSNIIFLAKLVLHILLYPDTMFFIQTPTSVVPYAPVTSTEEKVEKELQPKRRTSAALPAIEMSHVPIIIPNSLPNLVTVHLSSNIETIFGKDRFRIRPLLGRNPLFQFSKVHPYIYYQFLLLAVITYLSCSVIWSFIPLQISLSLIGVSYFIIITFILSNTDLTCLLHLVCTFDFLYFMFNIACLFILFIFYCEDYKDNPELQLVYTILVTLGGIMCFISMGSTICMPNLHNTVKIYLTLFVMIYFIYQRVLIGYGLSKFTDILIPFVYFDKEIRVDTAIANLLNIICIRLLKIAICYLTTPRVMPMISGRIRIRVLFVKK